MTQTSESRPAKNPHLRPEGPLAEVGAVVARLMRRARHRRAIRLTARACVHWAAVLMGGLMTEQQFATWCSSVYKAARAVARKEGA